MNVRSFGGIVHHAPGRGEEASGDRPQATPQNATPPRARGRDVDARIADEQCALA
jgi:hypothetical protein